MRAVLMVAFVLAATTAVVGCGDDLTAGGSCHPSYPDECLSADAADYDCEGGSGDGPEYVTGPVTVSWEVDDPDPFDLDSNADGTGCESY